MKFALIITLFLATSVATALDKEVKIPNSLGFSVTVEKSNNHATWNLYGAKSYESVLLFRLGLADANKLLQAANRADAFYKEISQSGKCPNNKVKSGSFGEIGEDSSMSFEVVCSNNRNSLQVTLSDEYVINYLRVEAKPIQIRQLAEKLIGELGGKVVPSRSVKQKEKTSSHSHNGRAHSHAMPAQGIGHRHGAGAIGK